MVFIFKEELWGKVFSIYTNVLKNKIETISIHPNLRNVTFCNVTTPLYPKTLGNGCA